MRVLYYFQFYFVSTFSKYEVCRPNPCANNGTCWSTDIMPVCNCVTGFTGFYCRSGFSWNIPNKLERIIKILLIRQVDLCQKTPCLNGGKCRVLRSGIRCDCLDGWTGEYCSRRIKNRKHENSVINFLIIKQGMSSTSYIGPAIFYDFTIFYAREF